MNQSNENSPENQKPANDEQPKVLSLAALADTLVSHVLQVCAGNMPNALSVANLVHLRIEEEYKFLLNRQLSLQFAALEALNKNAAPQPESKANGTI